MEQTSGASLHDAAHLSVTGAPQSTTKRPPRRSSRNEILQNLAGYSRSQIEVLLVDMLSRQKLGLYRERDLIQRDKALNDDHVFVEQVPEYSVGDGTSQNMIIEGDNFDTLRLLARTHAGRIRVIMIDPPYNRGKKDLVYNDCYVREGDKLRDSQWLEWLHPRLTLARDLLTSDGVIMVCIDDAKHAYVDLLLNDVFPGKRIGSFVWRSRIGSNEGGNSFLSVDHEHVIAYGNADFQFIGRAKSYGMFSNPDGDPRGDWRKSDMAVGVRYTDKRAGNCYYPIQDPVTRVWYPCNPDRVWVYASEAFMRPDQKIKTKTMEQFTREGKVLFPQNNRIATWDTMEDLLAAIDSGDVPRSGSGTPFLRRGLPDLDLWVGRSVGWGVPAFKRHKADLKNQVQPVSSWLGPLADNETIALPGTDMLSCHYTDEGTTSVQKALGADLFDYAKPPTLIRELMRRATGPNDIVLDFFAGSGTTAQAIMELLHPRIEHRSKQG